MTAARETEDDEYAGRWISAIDSLAASLAAFLGQEVTVVDPGEMEEAFCCSIRGPEPSGPPLHMAWDGILGMQFYEGKPDIRVTIFAYSRGRRLRLDDQSGSTLELFYDGPFDGSGTWRDDGWEEDGYGEYEGHDRYDYDA